MADDRATDRPDDETVAPTNRPAEPHSDEKWPERGDESESDQRSRIPIDVNALHEDELTDSRATGSEHENDVDPNVPEPSSAPIEAGDPNLENTLFVLLGAILMLAVVARLVSLTML